MTTTKTVFKLFIMPGNVNSVSAVEKMNGILADFPQLDLEFQVIDIRKNIELAEEYRILATPLLLREYPLPRMRVVGAIDSTHAVLAMVDDSGYEQPANTNTMKEARK